MANIDSVKLPNGNEYNLQDVVSAKGSQPNLLINGWFTVNQRGQSSYSSSGYTVDRWKKDDTGNVVINADGSITLQNFSSDGHDFTQMLEANPRLMGETVTFSILTDAGLNAYTFQIPSTIPGTTYAYDCGAIDGSNFHARFTLYTTGLLGFKIRHNTSTSNSLTVKAIKLEIGSASTLHLDTAPDYTTELLKCRRYFIRFTHAEQWKAFAIVQNISTSEASWVLNLPVPMRATPTFKSAGTFQLYAATPVLVSAFTASFPDLETVVVLITGSASNLTAWATSRLNNTTTNAYIELDAEL